MSIASIRKRLEAFSGDVALDREYWTEESVDLITHAPDDLALLLAVAETAQLALSECDSLEDGEDWYKRLTGAVKALEAAP